MLVGVGYTYVHVNFTWPMLPLVFLITIKYDGDKSLPVLVKMVVVPLSFVCQIEPGEA